MHHGRPPRPSTAAGDAAVCNRRRNTQTPRTLTRAPIVDRTIITGAVARRAYGPREPGRQLLLAVYLAILGLSVVLLAWGDPRVALGLSMHSSP